MKQTVTGSEAKSIREVAELIRSRRTIDLYLQTRVPVQLVRDAVEAASWAPNHYVTEPWRFYLLGPEAIGRCVDLVRDIVTAKKDAKAGDFKAKSWSQKPGWLVLTCQRSEDERRQREDYAACCAAAQNLLLYLWQAGVGSKWTTGDITRDPRFEDIVGFAADRETVVGLFWYGYPKLTPEQKRKDVGELLIERP